MGQMTLAPNNVAFASANDAVEAAALLSAGVDTE